VEGRGILGFLISCASGKNLYQPPRLRDVTFGALASDPAIPLPAG